MAGKYEKLLSISDDSFEFIDKSVRAMALNILRGVITETPRDQGFASANWNVTIGNASDNFSKAKTSAGTAQSEGSITIDGFKVENNKTMFIQNHAPYISRLNLGWSMQAGAFFVEKIIKRSI